MSGPRILGSFEDGHLKRSEVISHSRGGIDSIIHPIWAKKDLNRFSSYYLKCDPKHAFR